jgi:hypothetical protein
MNTAPAKSSAGYETTDIDLKTIAKITVAGLIILLIIIVLTWNYFTYSKEREVYNQVLKQENPVLQELITEANQQLYSYGIVDKEKGIYHIPIERAMELVIQEAAAHP